MDPNLNMLTFHDLMASDVKRWDVHMLHALFNNETVTSILETPILNDVHDDKSVWKFTKDGHYSVKSGYILFMDKFSNTDHLHVDGNWCM